MVSFVSLFAASLHRAIQCRFELNSKDEAIQVLSELNPGNRKDHEILLLYYVLPKNGTSITSHKFFSGGFLLNYDIESSLFGKSPKEISRLTIPKTFVITSQGTMEKSVLGNIKFD
jgi:hypothetical protein